MQKKKQISTLSKNTWQKNMNCLEIQFIGQDLNKSEDM